MTTPPVGPEPTLTSTTIRLNVAKLGNPNPLPMADSLLDMPYGLEADLPDEIRAGASFGHPRSMHPYLIQDCYSREREDQDVDAVVLDNGILRATFLPSVGGRLWSLIDCASGKDLLHANSAIQPANFALRNAWVAGGVEWNIGTKGHTAHTMSPLFAASATAPGGEPMLRMWEWDRLRQVTFQIDAYLPRGSRGLRVYIRITNDQDESVPMYWWSNIAVPQREDVRVITPADSAFATQYDGTIAETAIPTSASGADTTWPATAPRSADYFYRLRPGQAWITAVGADGFGLAQTSTERLRGRKLFCWGRGNGGKHWQRWLSPKGGEYAEIQAGLATTQLEHLPMPPASSWDWLEVYGNIDADPNLAHGNDWQQVTAHVGERIRDLAGQDELDLELEQMRSSADQPPHRLLNRGSGWGALANELRGQYSMGWNYPGHSPRPAPPGEPGQGIQFDVDSLSDEQQLWLLILEGEDPLRDLSPVEPPRSYVSGPEWREKLEALAPSWLRDYHLGVMAQAEGDLDRAKKHLSDSLHDRLSPWALRAQARVAREVGEKAEALNHLQSALEVFDRQLGLRSDLQAREAILIEALVAAREARVPGLGLELVRHSPRPQCYPGRIAMLQAACALEAGALEQAKAILQSGVVVPDIREGATMLSELWQQAFPGEEVPELYEFRMK